MIKLASDESEPDMRAEYDFSEGVRGKFAAALREEEYTIRKFGADGTFTETRVLGEETAPPALNV